MAGDVKIVLTAVDHASQTLQKVGTGFKTMGLSLTDLWSGINLAKQGLDVLKGGFDKTVGVTVDYNKQIREMTQVTGLGAEEISRIVQVGDDWGIEIGALRTSLGYMNKQGIAPSIENLAKLADEYVSTTDKSKFAEKAAKLLGRQYQTLIPLFAKGGDALRAQAAAIDENLIATEESIQATREYEVALDNLNDQVEATQMSIGKRLVPATAEFLELLSSPSANNAADVINDLFKGTFLESEWSKAVSAAAALSEGIGPDMQERLRGMAQGLNEVDSAADGASGGLNNAAIAIGELSKAQMASAAMAALNAELEAGTISLGQYEHMVEVVGYEILGLSSDAVQGQIKMARLKEAYDSGKISASQYVRELEALGRSIDNLHDKTIDITVNTWYKEYYQRHGEGPNPRQHGGPGAKNEIYWTGEAGPEPFIAPANGQFLSHSDAMRALSGGATGGGDIYATFNIFATPNQSPKAIAREALAMLGEAQRYAQAGGGYQGV